MKLVLCYSVGDGYTYSADIVQPFEYESVFAAEYDLLIFWEKYRDGIINAQDEKVPYPYPNIKFAGLEIDLSDLTYYSEDKLHKRQEPKYYTPEIYELNDWWEKNRPQKLIVYDSDGNPIETFHNGL